jgi:hypothetical protein
VKYRIWNLCRLEQKRIVKAKNLITNNFFSTARTEAGKERNIKLCLTYFSMI